MRTNTTAGRIIIGRLDKGDDLLNDLTDLCRSKRITAGTFNVIGAVQQASLGYYDQRKNKYRDPLQLKHALEIVSCSGNISLKDKKPFIHAHIVLADDHGRAFGGHLMPGTIVFAAEFVIRELKGISLNRIPDRSTGLFLWKK
jgi:predicted DNA-binding protein with PD1-like motif